MTVAAGHFHALHLYLRFVFVIYVLSYTCIAVTVIAYAIIIICINFILYMYFCDIFVFICMYSLLNILWISDLKKYYYNLHNIKVYISPSIIQLYI